MLFARTCALRLAAGVALALAGCSGRPAGDFLLTSTGLSDDGDVENPFLSEDRRYSVTRIEVPEHPCVRRFGTPVEELPEGAELPGEPGLFFIVQPDEADRARGDIAFVPHGNSLDFAEHLVAFGARTYPRAFAFLDIDTEAHAGYAHQLTREFAEASAMIELRRAIVAGYIERGFTVVVPGNCWGDLGMGTGEAVTTELTAPRYGQVHDRYALDYAIERYHRPGGRIAADGCSGGGSRIGQQLQRDPEVFDLAVIDSPADDIGGFREAPFATFVQDAYLIDGVATNQIMDNYMVGFGGSLDGIRQRSLGRRLGIDVHLNIPILYAISSLDPLTPPPLTYALRDALTDPRRYSHPKARVIQTEAPVHCQFINVDGLREERFRWVDDRLRELE